MLPRKKTQGILNPKVVVYFFFTTFWSAICLHFTCRFSFKVLPKEEEEKAPEPVSESPVESSTPGSYYFRFYK